MPWCEGLAEDGTRPLDRRLRAAAEIRIDLEGLTDTERSVSDGRAST